MSNPKQLRFGSEEARSILKEDRQAWMPDDMYETVAVLYAMLKMRDGCDECGGHGFCIVASSDRDVDYETCVCSRRVEGVLKKYERRFVSAAMSYLKVGNEVWMDGGTIPLEKILERALDGQ